MYFQIRIINKMIFNSRYTKRLICSNQHNLLSIKGLAHSCLSSVFRSNNLYRLSRPLLTSNADKWRPATDSLSMTIIFIVGHRDWPKVLFPGCRFAHLLLPLRNTKEWCSMWLVNVSTPWCDIRSWCERQLHNGLPERASDQRFSRRSRHMLRRSESRAAFNIPFAWMFSR